MKKKLLSLCLTVTMLMSLFAVNVFADEGNHSAVIGQNQSIDVLITADETYIGSPSDYASQLSDELTAKGLTADDVRITTVDTNISLSNFDDWYVYDHYYNPESATNGAVPSNWNNYSGRHPYFYYKEQYPSMDDISDEDFLSAEADLHEELWSDYDFQMYSCGTDTSDLQSTLFKKSYDKLGDDDKAAADAAVLTIIRDWVAGDYYEKTYDELSDDEKANEELVDDINYDYNYEYFSFYPRIDYDSLSTEDKAAADVLILQVASKDIGTTFNNYEELISYVKDYIAGRYYPGKTYDELTDDEKANEDLVYVIKSFCDNYIKEYYPVAAINALDSNGKKALADEYLIENNVKLEYESNNPGGDYTGLSNDDKAALLKAYKDNYYDSEFSAYMDEGESFADVNMTDERMAEIISDYYYGSYIHNDSYDAYYEIAEYASSRNFYTDITSEGSLDAIHYRDKHIYTSIDGNNNANMTFLGYSSPAYKDFLIYPTTMENEKNVSFDIDASKVSTHTLEGAGFLINSGIDKNGYIHGYILFYQFDDATDGTVYLLKIKDKVKAEALHNSANSRSIMNYTEVPSASQTFEMPDSMKKNISVDITPESVTCNETDYVDGTLDQDHVNQLFSGAVDLDSTGYNGFGPITSYYSHSCSQISAFTFSNLKMSYESSSVDSLRSATYIDGAKTKKVYIVLTGNPETDIHSDLNAYNELLARLSNDEIFYVTTGGDITINASGKNGLDLSESDAPAADAADYIAKLSTGETTWTDTSLPTGAGLLPVAIFDITGSDGSQIMSLDRTYIGANGITMKFGNLNKSVALATDKKDLSYTYTVYDPSGNAMDLGGTDNNELTLNSTAALGKYTFALKVAEGDRTSVTATRILNVSASPVVVPETNGGHSGGGGNTNTNNVEVLVNGKTENAGTLIPSQEGDRSVSTVVVDPKKLDARLEAEGNNTVVTIPINTKSDIKVGELTGQMVKNMETKEAILEIKTENVTYTLPAGQINIDDVSEQLGQNVDLKDIKVNVTIAAPPQDTVKVVEDTANKNNYQIVVKPVEFDITCTSGDKTVDVSKFNGYVERAVAIPDGIDPSKITTGIVLNNDGTFSHVPTTIVNIGGKYYAKINSLTNSTYSVIYNPKIFVDVENHWAKDYVNEMGSRLVVAGIDANNFAPDRDITRAEFAAIVIRALGLTETGKSKQFSDVKDSDWFTGSVAKATEYGIVQGMGDGSFMPNKAISREEAMVMIARAMKIAELDTNISEADGSAQLSHFNDNNSVSAWARTSAAACIKLGVMEGSNGSLRPQSNITRAETAAVVMRMLKQAGLI